MQGFLGNHWGAKTAALILAIFLWLHVLTNDLYEDTLEIPLRIEVVTDGLERANPVPQGVHVRFKGEGKQLVRLRYSGVSMVVRTLENRIGKRSYPLSASDVRIPIGLRVEAVEVVAPASVEIILDRLIEKKVPVEADVALKTAPGYTKVGRIELDPDSVLVRGPQRFVEAVHAVKLKPLKLSEAEEDVRSFVRVIVPPGENVVCISEQVQVSADIQAIIEQWIEDIPIHLTHAPRGAKVDPPTVDVKIRGGIDQVKSLSTDDIRAYMDYRSIARGEEQNPQPVFIMPPGMKLMETRPQTFRVVVR